MSFTIAIIGRPNVGKSTLFNRLTGKKHALVDNAPGTTRDRREGEAQLADLAFQLVDTAGLEEDDAHVLAGRMMQQTKEAIREADLCLLMVDGRVGITPADRYFAQLLRKSNTNVLLVVNKSEGDKALPGVAEALGLGFETVAISAEHGEGMGELYDAVQAFIRGKEKGLEDAIEESDVKDNAPLQIAVVGRPNAGKSTLMNALLGEERVLTGPEAGITRDAIRVAWEYKGRPVQLIDTAGIRKRAKVTQKVEKLAVADGLRAIRYAQVVLMLVDATCPFEKQDIAIADTIIQEGRGIVIGINKWDTIRQKKAVLEEIDYLLNKHLPLVRGVPVVPFSALHKEKTNALLDAAFAVYEQWQTQLPTGQLNRWLEMAEAQHVPPLAKNKRPIRLKFMKQTKTRPPSFTVFSNRPEDLPDSYQRYLINSLREHFGLSKTPIRLTLKKGENPYR